MTSARTPRLLRLTPQVVLKWIYLWAFVFGGFAASRCVRMDAAITYLGGLRLISGQVLYQDFSLPHGPLSVLIMAALLKITPTGGWAVIIGTGLLNMIAAFLIGSLVLKATKSFYEACVAAFLTAIWFLPVFGWIYIDHIAFVFILASARSLCFLGSSRYLVALSALMATCALHTKLSVAIPGLAAIFISFILVYGFTSLVRVKLQFWILSLAFCLSASMAIIYFNSPWPEYFAATFHNPIQYWLNPDSPKKSMSLLTNLLFPFGIDPLRMLMEIGWGRLLFYPIILLIYASYFAVLRLHMKKDAQLALCVLLTTTIFCGALIGRNHTHLFFGSGGIIAMTLWAFPAVPRIIRSALILWIGAAGLILANSEAEFFHAPQNTQLTHSKLSPIRIAESSSSAFNLKVYDLATTSDSDWALLTDREGFMPLMAAGVAPVNYELLHHDSLSIPFVSEPRRAWQQKTISQLHQRGVRFIIANDPVHLGFRSVQDDGSQPGMAVPELETYLKENYQKIMSRGTAHIWERNRAP